LLVKRQILAATNNESVLKCKSLVTNGSFLPLEAEILKTWAFFSWPSRFQAPKMVHSGKCLGVFLLESIPRILMIYRIFLLI